MLWARIKVAYGFSPVVSLLLNKVKKEVTFL